MQKILVICGPTGAGKTAAAIHLATLLNGELVSADSRQVYKEMDIGTGKDLPRKSKIKNLEFNIDFRNKNYELFAYDMFGVPIWMYDVVLPNEDFSVSHFQSLATSVIKNIWSRSKLPILVGGTGFYIDALLNPPDTISVPRNDKLREELLTLSSDALQLKLNTINPQILASMNNSDRNNPRRLVRRIELEVNINTDYMVSKIPVSDVLMIGLTMPKQKLDKKIDARVDARVEDGIIREIQDLLGAGYSWNIPSMSGLGYSQWKTYFEARVGDRKKLIGAIIHEWKTAEQHYAKRQLTWFKKRKTIIWYDSSIVGYERDIAERVNAWYTQSE
ncbi:MAG TPA: tRNA (adenosine(37)-N6)-dimethylallyltransferase MiaA [Patescibacteria group bacterium]|nr:tRNA (adenosine(37)-N6)-dimethylallyltransferase MiaA [Patescibacteria group bacterium]